MRICFEKTNFGDITTEHIEDIWNNKKFSNLRKAMRKGRLNYPFCKECDVVDAGEREESIRAIIH